MIEDVKNSQKTSSKGKDGYKVFSIRVKNETLASLDQISEICNRSRNEIINLFLRVRHQPL